MFIDALKTDIDQAGVFDWHTDDTLIHVAGLLIGRVIRPGDVTALFERFYRDALLSAPVGTMTRTGFESLRDQPPITDERTVRVQWFEFPDPLPGLEEWRGCLLAPMPDPRKVFGSTADNKRPPGVCCLILFGDADRFLVSHVFMNNGQLAAANIGNFNLSDQAVLGGTSLKQKSQETEKIGGLWKAVLALQQV